MRWFSAFLSFFSIVCATVAAAEVATIHLTDGSTIVGEVRSLTNGTYLIEGESLGTVEVPQAQVRVVQYGTSNGPAPTDRLASEPAVEIESLTASLLANPTILSIIQSLQQDPAFQAVAADPEIQRAISAGDYLSLMNDPRIRQLMSHSAVQAISAEIQR